MAQQDQGPCFVVLGIVFMAFGFFVFWPLMFIGVFFFIIGICTISQQSRQTTATSTHQTTPQPSPQPTLQPAPQALPQPAPAQVNEIPRFCPHCGAHATSSYCSECGSNID